MCKTLHTQAQCTQQKCNTCKKMRVALRVARAVTPLTCNTRLSVANTVNKRRYATRNTTATLHVLHSCAGQGNCNDNTVGWCKHHPHGVASLRGSVGWNSTPTCNYFLDRTDGERVPKRQSNWSNTFTGKATQLGDVGITHPSTGFTAKIAAKFSVLLFSDVVRFALSAGELFGAQKVRLEVIFRCVSCCGLEGAHNFAPWVCTCGRPTTQERLSAVNTSVRHGVCQREDVVVDGKVFLHEGEIKLNTLRVYITNCVVVATQHNVRAFK
jgi:hypothetical protein